MLLISMLATASVAVPLTDLDPLVAEVAPHVERIAGRRFLEVPSGGLAVAQELAELVAPPHADPGVAADRVRAVRRDLEQKWAFYSPWRQRVYLVTDSLKAIVKEARILRDEAEPLVRCVIAHELTHALQHQVVGYPADLTEGQRRSLRTLMEGHATAVAIDYCEGQEGSRITQIMKATSGIDTIASRRADDPFTPYAWGSHLVASLQQEDPERIWQALATPPPEWAELSKVLQASLPAGWGPGGALEGALRANLEVVDVRAAAPSIWRRFGGLFDHPFTGETPLFGSAGASVESRVSDRTVRVTGFLLPDGEPERLVELRRRQAKRGRLAFFGDRPEAVAGAGAVGRANEFRKIPGNQATLSLMIPTRPARTYEWWLATDRVLLQLVIVGRAMGPRARASLLGAAVAGLEVSEPQPVEFDRLGDWMKTVRATPAPRGPSMAYRRARTAFEAGAEDPLRCRTAFADLESAPEVAAAGFRCAVGAGDREFAERARPHLTSLEPGLAADHAATLREVHEHESALETLRMVDDQAATDEHFRIELVHAYLSLGDLESARPLLAEWVELPPRFRARMAMWLFEQGDRRGARPLLMATCAYLSGDEASQCNAMLSR